MFIENERGAKMAFKISSTITKLMRIEYCKIWNAMCVPVWFIRSCLFQDVFNAQAFRRQATQVKVRKVIYHQVIISGCFFFFNLKIKHILAHVCPGLHSTMYHIRICISSGFQIVNDRNIGVFQRSTKMCTIATINAIEEIFFSRPYR